MYVIDAWWFHASLQGRRRLAQRRPSDKMGDTTRDAQHHMDDVFTCLYLDVLA